MSASTSRRFLLIAAVICFGAFITWLALPLAGESTPNYARYGVVGTPLAIMLETWDTAIGPNAIFLGMMLLAQWMFLRPLRRSAAAPSGKRRPRWMAVASAAFAAMMLCVAFVATVLEMPDAWKSTVNTMAGHRMWIAVAVIWALWCVVFLIYFRGGDFLSRAEVLVRALIRGTLLELLVAIPTHAVVYRRSDECYCERGSYTGIVFGVAVLLWTFGPGLVLLYLREKARRTPVLERLCPGCGATIDTSASPLSTCPRCGAVLHVATSGSVREHSRVPRAT